MEQSEMGAPAEKSGGSKVLKVVGIGCLVVVLIGAGLVYYVVKNAKRWGTGMARAGVVAVVEASGLPEDQQKGVIAHVDRVVEAYKADRITTQEVGDILTKLMESPVFSLAMVSMADTKYVQPSGLSEEEKEQGGLDLQRLARGVVEKTISGDEINGIVAIISTKTSDGNTKLKEKLTDEEVREFLAAVKEKADAAEIPDEPYLVDPVAEIGKIVDEALEGK